MDISEKNYVKAKEHLIKGLMAFQQNFAEQFSMVFRITGMEVIETTRGQITKGAWKMKNN